MSWTPRMLVDNGIYHVIARGNNRRLIVQDEADRRMWFNLLVKALNKSSADLIAMCLMSNHFHVVLRVPQGEALPTLMLTCQTSYAQYFNGKYGRSGHLFQGRYHSVLIQGDAALRQVARYVHLNPVEAGMVTDPARYPWSNYAVILGLRKDYVTREQALLSQFDSDSFQARMAYMEFVLDGIKRPDPWWTLENLLQTKVLR